MNNIIYGDKYCNLPLLQEPEGHYESILLRTKQLMDFNVLKHKEIFFVRLDLHFPTEGKHYEGNTHITGFIEAMVRYYKRKKIDLQYLWVRERIIPKKQHYHLYFFINRHKIQKPYGIFKKADELWSIQLGCNCSGLVNLADTNAIAVIRLNDLNYQAAFKRASYLAKVRTKDTNGGRCRRFGASQIP